MPGSLGSGWRTKLYACAHTLNSIHAMHEHHECDHPLPGDPVPWVGASTVPDVHKQIYGSSQARLCAVAYASNSSRNDAVDGVLPGAGYRSGLTSRTAIVLAAFSVAATFLRLSLASLSLAHLCCSVSSPIWRKPLIISFASSTSRVPPRSCSTSEGGRNGSRQNVGGAEWGRGGRART